MPEDFNRSNRIHWGVGRVAFHANQSEIEKLLQAGWSVTQVHVQLKNSLGGLSYRQFADYVSRKLPDAQPWRQRAPGTARSWRAEASRASATLLAKHFIPGPRVPDLKDLY